MTFENASRYTAARVTAQNPTAGFVRSIWPDNSGAAPIGSEGTIQARRPVAASHRATKAGELVSARCTGVPGSTPWLRRN